MNLYSKRREMIFNSMRANCAIMLFSGKAPMRSQDEAYEFSVNRNFYYLTGLDAEDKMIEQLDGQKSQVYNYALQYKAITTKEAKVLLGVQDRRARKILADMCDAGILMKKGATSNLKYVIQKD